MLLASVVCRSLFITVLSLFCTIAPAVAQADPHACSNPLAGNRVDSFDDPSLPHSRLDVVMLENKPVEVVFQHHGVSVTLPVYMLPAGTPLFHWESDLSKAEQWHRAARIHDELLHSTIGLNRDGLQAQQDLKRGFYVSLHPFETVHYGPNLLALVSDEPIYLVGTQRLTEQDESSSEAYRHRDVEFVSKRPIEQWVAKRALEHLHYLLGPDAAHWQQWLAQAGISAIADGYWDEHTNLQQIAQRWLMLFATKGHIHAQLLTQAEQAALFAQESYWQFADDNEQTRFEGMPVIPYGNLFYTIEMMLRFAKPEQEPVWSFLARQAHPFLRFVGQTGVAWQTTSEPSMRLLPEVPAWSTEFSQYICSVSEGTFSYVDDKDDPYFATVDSFVTLLREQLHCSK